MQPTDERHPRCHTNRLLKAIDDGLLSHETLVQACLGYMSDSDVAAMTENEELLYDEYEEWDD